MNICILSYCRDFGETPQADRLVTLLNQNGHHSQHWGMKEKGIPDFTENPDLIILFYNWQYEYWNQEIISQLNRLSPRTPILIYSDNHGYEWELARRFPAVLGIVYAHCYDSWFSIVNAIPSQQFQRCFNLLYKGKNGFVRTPHRLESMPLNTIQNREDLSRKKLKHALIGVNARDLNRNDFYCHPLEGSVSQDKYKDAVAIEREICFLANNMKIKGIHFIDIPLDNDNHQRLWNIVATFNNLQQPIPYSANLSVPFVLRESATRIIHLCKSGFYRVYLDTTPYTFPFPAVVADAIRRWRCMHIDIHFNYNNFTPYSTLDELAKKAAYLKSIGGMRFSHLIGRSSIMLNTPLYKRLRQDSLLYAGEGIQEDYHFRDKQVDDLASFMMIVYHRLQGMGFDEGGQSYEMIAFLYAIATHYKDTVSMNRFIAIKNYLDIRNEQLMEKGISFFLRCIDIAGRNKLANCLDTLMPVLIEDHNLWKTVTEIRSVKKKILFTLSRSPRQYASNYLNYL